MKKIRAVVLFISGILFAGYSFANENYDLKCTLDDGEHMTLSHANDTVYIAFLAPGDDPDEGGSVIKLDIPSGEVKQVVRYNDGKITLFGIRGDSPDAESTVVVSYHYEMKTFLENKGAKHVYTDVMTFSSQDKNTGKTIENRCITDTVKVGNTLTKNGIPGVSNIE
ncbi:hypothetical protein QF25_15935 [Salmonella enterica subsp. enterica]|nr:hypothetical protein [Salmonella enterica subsp. enterica]EDW1097493.1 hypothetical protein [Salmonella enterica subsp. enterica]MIM34117.1 hypothetical protein [Salmonella enterica subsp. enterica]